MAEHVHRERLLVMDQETIRLLVTGLLTASAGIGGAVIAGFFNRRNTHAVIRAGADAAEATRRHEKSLEHTQWLRDRKLAAYTTLMAQMQELDLLIQDTHKFPGASDTSRIPELASKLGSDELMLLVPKKVDAGITSLFLGVRAMIAATETFPAGEEREAAYEKAADEFATRFVKLRSLIREDLGAKD